MVVVNRLTKNFSVSKLTELKTETGGVAKIKNLENE